MTRIVHGPFIYIKVGKLADEPEADGLLWFM